MCTTTCCFLDLPDDLIGCLPPLLDSQSSLALAGTSQRVRQITLRHLYTCNVRKHRGFGVDGVAEFVRHCPDLAVLHCGRLSDAALRTIAHECPNLIELDANLGDVTAVGLLLCPAQCRLRVLRGRHCNMVLTESEQGLWDSIDNYYMTDSNLLSSALTELSLTRSEFPPQALPFEAAVFRLAMQFTSLERLRLCGSEEIAQSMMDELLSRLPRLRALRLKFAGDVGDQLQLPSTSLEELWLPEADMSEVPRALGDRLRVLVNPRGYLPSLAKVGRHCPNLEMVRLEPVDGTVRKFASFHTYPYLHTLEIATDLRVADALLLGKQCPALASVRCESFVPAKTRDTPPASVLHALLEAAPNLISVHTVMHVDSRNALTLPASRRLQHICDDNHTQWSVDLVAAYLREAPRVTALTLPGLHLKDDSENVLMTAALLHPELTQFVVRCTPSLIEAFIGNPACVFPNLRRFCLVVDALRTQPLPEPLLVALLGRMPQVRDFTVDGPVLPSLTLAQHLVRSLPHLHNIMLHSPLPMVDPYIPFLSCFLERPRVRGIHLEGPYPLTESLSPLLPQLSRCRQLMLYFNDAAFQHGFVPGFYPRTNVIGCNADDDDGGDADLPIQELEDNPFRKSADFEVYYDDGDISSSCCTASESDESDTDTGSYATEDSEDGAVEEASCSSDSD